MNRTIANMVALLIVAALLSMFASPMISTSPAAESPERAMADLTAVDQLFPVSLAEFAEIDDKKPVSGLRDGSVEDRMAAYPAGDSGYRPLPVPQRETGGARSTRAPGDSCIFYDGFESGTSQWNINSGGGSTYWAATTDRPGYGDHSLYCAGVNPVQNQLHTVFYDTAEYYYNQEDRWTMGDSNSNNGFDYWAGTDTRSSPRYPVLSQDFSGATFPPTGWAQSGPSSQWGRVTTDNAGGASAEARFSWVNSVGTWRLYAGPLNTEDMSRVDLRFRQFFYDYAAGVTVKVQTSSDGTLWNDAGWSINSGGGNAAEYVSLSLTTVDVGSSTFYVSWTVEGNAYQLNYWYIDDVALRYESWSYYCAEAGSQTPRADHEARRNDTDVSIPDSNTWVFSQLRMDEAPADAVIDYIELQVTISHPRHADLVIDLEDTDIIDDTYQSLWNLGSGSGTLTISRTVVGGNAINAFNGMPVNQRWRLYARDTVAGNSGYIDSWWIKVHYTNSQIYDSYQTSYMKQAVDLSGHTDCKLSFHFWLDVEAGYDYLRVRASTTDYANPLDAGWTTLATYTTSFDSQNTSSQYHITKWYSSGDIDISAFDGQTVYLMFLFYSDNIYEREGAYVDNIKITGYGKSYANNMNTYAETEVDLTGYDNAYLSFIYWLDAEDYYDVFNVSVKKSTDSSWTKILELNEGYDDFQYDGADPDLMARNWWNTGHLSLDAFCGDPAVKIRFWFRSDGSAIREGIYIDEVEIASIFFFDDMESGAGNWYSTSTAQPNWHLVNNNYYSYDHSWWCGSDATGQYGSSMDEYLIHPFDLRTAETATLRFLLTGHTNANDYFFVGITMDDGENWHYYGGLSGDYPGWWQFEIDLTQYLHRECWVAFNLYTNKSQESIGYWVDDVSVYGTRDRTAPAQVMGLDVEPGVEGESLALIWNANSEIDLSHYRVYRSLTAGGPYGHVANSSTNSYLDAGLARDTSYYYVVSALDFAGNEGPVSLEASSITNDTTPPAPAQGVEAMDLQTGGVVNVSWLPNNEKDLAGYKLYYSTSNFTDTSGATYYPLSPIDDAGATNWEIYGLENNVAYHFAVTAIDKSGNENTTIEKTAVATPTDQTPPLIIIDHPTNSTEVSGTVSITVTAGDASGITGVRIYINKGLPVNATYDHFLRKWVYQWNTAAFPDCEVVIEAETSDTYGNTATDSVTVTTVPAPYDICLFNHTAPSWAFLSFPVNITGNIQDILNDAIHGDAGTAWSVAKWYDGQTKTWKSYRAGGVQTLTTVNNQMGVWIWLTSNGGDKTLTTGVMGYYPQSDVQIQLYAGWNMVGYPSATQRTFSNALAGTGADMVARYISTSPWVEDILLPSDGIMSSGNAYWIHVPADVSWVISGYTHPPSGEIINVHDDASGATRGGSPPVPEAEECTFPARNDATEVPSQIVQHASTTARADWLTAFLPTFLLALGCLGFRRRRNGRIR